MSIGSEPAGPRQWEANRAGTRQCLQQFGEFLLKARHVNPKAAPYCVRWVRLFLARPAENAPLGDQIRAFVEELARGGRWQDWQVQQAEQAIRIYFGSFLQRTDWQRSSPGPREDEDRRVWPLTALGALRDRLRTRHYSYRTESSYADWVRRFFDHLVERQGAPHAQVDDQGVRDFLIHPAVDRPVSPTTPESGRTGFGI